MKNLFIFFAFCFVIFPLHAEIWEAKVVKIADGDTFTVFKDGNRIRVRLAEINAPEEGRPWSRQSKQALKSQIAGKVVKIDQLEYDPFNRVVAIVYVNSTNINEWMILNGHAWVRRRYLKNLDLLVLEEQARGNKLGIWSLPERDFLDAVLW